MSRIKGAIAITVVALSLSGCGQYKALPNEQRYQFINDVKDAVDLPSAGTIFNGGYDNGDGVFSPSSYAVEIEGKDSYEKVKAKLVSFSDIRCKAGNTQTTCRNSHVDILLQKSRSQSDKVYFSIIDQSSGRL